MEKVRMKKRDNKGKKMLELIQCLVSAELRIMNWARVSEGETNA